jgi:glycosyltransferase involved in cell wall biosynthesis
MNRYWQEMVAQASGQPGFRSLLTPVPIQTPGGPTWRRFFVRYVLYPWKIQTKVRGGVLHLLDHSFAHVLPFVPSKVRTVVTVHDLIPLVDAGGLSHRQIARFARNVGYLQRADRLVCVSENTRDEVCRLLSIPREKMVVNPMGAATLPLADPAMTERLRTLGPYLLSVGHTATRKNLRILPALLAELKSAGSQPVLVRAGTRMKEDLAHEIRAQAELHELGLVTDAELAAAYANAELLILPSTHEGFGLPVIEAMAQGCPVVCSKATSLPEVAGEAGLMFDPSAPAEAALHCRRLLEDANLRAHHRVLGLNHAAAFTYRAHWQRMQPIYQNLLNA